MAEQGREAQSQPGAASHKLGSAQMRGRVHGTRGLAARGPAGHIWGSLNKRANHGGKDDDLWRRISISESVRT